MTKLKPCPFCGSNDAFICNIRMPDLTSTFPFAKRSVLCPNCGMGVTFGYELKTPNGLTDEEVREANKLTEMEWNRRGNDERTD